jgi:predicted SnoaL-like aldol condensation-catalyzing enzyme
MGGTDVATGKAVNWQAMSISRMTDGKIIEEWDLEVRVPVTVEA